MTGTAATKLKDKQKKIARAETLATLGLWLSFVIAVFLCAVWVGLFSVPKTAEVVLGWISLASIAFHFICRFTALHFQGALTFK